MNHSKKIYKSIMLVIIVALVTFILTSVFVYHKLGGTIASGEQIINPELVKKIYAIKQIIDHEYISDVDETNLINQAIKGYVEGIGDEYTEYFTKEEMEEFKTETEGSYVGIGIYMLQNTKDNTVVILTPIENSPAAEAGLLPGDVIKKIDDVEYTGEDFDKIAAYIKGKKETKVKLEIEREGKTLTFEVERRNIDLYPIKSEMLENNIGYIQIASFDEDSSKDFKKAYQALNKNNLKGLIIDLRNNGGGIVEEALEMADTILEKGDTILITKDKEGKENIQKSEKEPIIKVPIVVLTNENTASASEILVAALKEHHKATIIGKKTYGKGVIQELITLSDGSGMKITIEEYYTPNGNKINQIGITPDQEVSLPETVETNLQLDKKEDTQLQEAIKTFAK